MVGLVVAFSMLAGIIEPLALEMAGSRGGQYLWNAFWIEFVGKAALVSA